MKEKDNKNTLIEIKPISKPPQNQSNQVNQQHILLIQLRTKLKNKTLTIS